MNLVCDTLFILLKSAIGKDCSSHLSENVDWTKLVQFAAKQGIVAISFDGFLNIYDASDANEKTRMDAAIADIKYSWFSFSVSSEKEYQANERAIIKLSKFFDDNGVKMLLLKGYGLSQNYPIPSHRPVGDIDVYNFGLWEFSDKMVQKKLGIEVDSGHEHHTTYLFDSFLVENHYDIVDTKSRRLSSKIDEELKRLASISSRRFNLENSTVYLPGADFNAIFLIRHLGQHFAGESVSIRHLLDWGLFLDKESDNINWDYVIDKWREYGIYRFVCCINSICADKLGISRDKFHGCLSEESKLTNRILNDILNPEFAENKPNGSTASVVWFKTRRYFANAWKRKLVFKEGLIDTFVRSAISHLKHFDTIRD